MAAEPEPLRLFPICQAPPGSDVRSLTAAPMQSVAALQVGEAGARVKTARC